MKFSDYQKVVTGHAIYPEVGNNFVFPMIGLQGELGEVAEKLKKYMRDEAVATPKDINEDQRAALQKEIGDVLWYLTQLSTELGISLEEAANQNLEKIASRLERGVLGGSGDER